MRNGVHLIELATLPALHSAGVHVPTPYIGVLDLCRLVEGWLPEPEPAVPLGIVGIDELVQASGDGAGDALRRVRKSVHSGKGYFSWKEIPLVFLVAGRLTGSPGEGVVLESSGRSVGLAPLVGKSLAPVEGQSNWWWATQPG